MGTFETGKADSLHLPTIRKSTRRRRGQVLPSARSLYVLSHKKRSLEVIKLCKNVRKFLASGGIALKKKCSLKTVNASSSASQSNVRESGENPERLRHCNRLQTPRSH